MTGGTSLALKMRATGDIKSDVHNGKQKITVLSKEGNSNLAPTNGLCMQSLAF